MKQSIWHGCYDENLKALITPESFAHPAKMAKRLTERIFDYGAEQGYWQPGDVIVDPFGGIGTTGLIGSYRGYRVVSVELEPRFFRMATRHNCPGVSKRQWLRWYGRFNRIASLCPLCQGGVHLEYRGDGRIPSTDPHLYIGNIEKNRTRLNALGRPLPVVIQGDSRNLAQLISECIGSIFSPPLRRWFSAHRRRRSAP